MPVIVAIAIRYIIMAAVQLGIWTLIEKYGIPLINNAIANIMQAFGVSEETATDIMANKVLRAFEEVGIFAVTLRTKLPIKAAEKLGFTSKGYAIRKIITPAAIKAETAAISAVSKAAATSVEIEKISEVVASTRAINASSVKTVLNYIFKYAGLTTGIFFAAAQYIDFANWQGPYQKYFQKLLSSFGIDPDTPMPKANVVSADIWKRIWATVEELHPYGVSDPFTGVDKPYSRQALSDLVDSVAANIVKSGGSASYKEVMAIVLPLVQLSGQPEDEAKINDILSTKANITKTSSSSSSSGVSYSLTVLEQQKALNKLGAGLVEDGILGPKTKAAIEKYGVPTVQQPSAQVITGILSQGQFSSTVNFSARPSDLIVNAQDLKEAVHNNLAPFITSLASRLSYEIKIVPTIQLANGFSQKGTVQKVVTGYDKKGNPKYKSVVNKFATLNVKIKTAQGSFTSLASINLGPVDSVKFSGESIDLNSIINNVQQTIVAPQAVVNKTITYTEPPKSSITYAPLEAYLNKNGLATDSDSLIELFKEFTEANHDENQLLGAVSGDLIYNKSERIKKAYAHEGTLRDYFNSKSQQLPSIQDRATLYEQLGLGQASYYLGTAEQNIKMLNALKNQ